MEHFNSENTSGIDEKTLSIMNELFEEEIETVTGGDWYYKLGSVVIEDLDVQRKIERLEILILELVDAY